MRETLQGKVALVTGGAGGIGQAVARALAGAGARVALAGRNEATLRTVELPGPPAMVVPLDVRDEGGWDRAVGAVLRHLGRIDVLVHNAGVLEVGTLESRTVEAIRSIVDTNLTGAMLGTRAALPALRETRGAIVHVASLGGLVPMPFEVAYGATKAGLRHLSFSLRAELAGSGVTVSVVTPDSVDTPQLRQELGHDEASLSFASPPMQADAIGRAVLAAIRGGAPEVLVPAAGGLVARIAAAFPCLLLWILPFLRRSGARRMARMRGGPAHAPRAGRLAPPRDPGQSAPVRDTLYDSVPFRVPEIEHRYGANVHLLADPLMLDLLAKLAAKETEQPAVNNLVVDIYRGLSRVVLNAEFPRKVVEVPTRMIDHTPEGIWRGQILEPETRAVTVNIARAGAVPSHTVYGLLNTVLLPRLVRQDHIIMSRMLGASDHVVGAGIGGMKIGGDVDGVFLLFPDPMGATGSSLSMALDTYKKKVPGTPRKIIALHLVVTPEYLRRMRKDHPEVVVYAVRLDRGLSPEKVKGTVPGTYWDEEKGLNDHDYIVPGAGGLGEVMNNAWV